MNDYRSPGRKAYAPPAVAWSSHWKDAVTARPEHPCVGPLFVEAFRLKQLDRWPLKRLWRARVWAWLEELAT